MIMLGRNGSFDSIARIRGIHGICLPVAVIGMKAMCCFCATGSSSIVGKSCIYFKGPDDIAVRIPIVDGIGPAFGRSSPCLDGRNFFFQGDCNTVAVFQYFCDSLKNRSGARSVLGMSNCWYTKQTENKQSSKKKSQFFHGISSSVISIS